MSKPAKTIVNLEMLNTLTEGCPGCGKRFSLGDPVVSACGAWEGGQRYVHANEAVFDPKTSAYMERKCYEASRGSGVR